MKVKRQKHVRRVLTFYRNNFGLKPPYKVLIDGTFCKAALSCKVNISEQMPKYLEAETKLYTTACIKSECEAFGTLLYGPLKVLQQFSVYPCGHGASIGAARCLNALSKKSVLDTKKFLIATQDQDLKEKLQKLSGIPILFLAYNAINIEPPSEKSQKLADTYLQSKITPSEHSQKVLKQLKIEAFGEQPEVKIFKKKKGPKGPNPLSCKKSKKKKKMVKDSAVKDNAINNKRKRRKKHKKMPGTLKEHFHEMTT